MNKKIQVIIESKFIPFVKEPDLIKAKLTIDDFFNHREIEELIDILHEIKNRLK